MDTSQTSSPNGEATQFALRVALQTMKDRCQTLQKRLNALEEENQQLRTTTTRGPTTSKGSGKEIPVGFAAENFQLRLQMADLQRQKTQLTEQIDMVSSENKKLWSRLSQMAKDQTSKERDSDIILTSYGGADQGVGSGANQNLIRSKTFTQHSPNPNLRHKIVSDDRNDEKDLSLEKVALTSGAGEEMAKMPESELGFSYLNMDENNLSQPSNISEHAFELEIKKYSDGLQGLQREALQQQKELCKTLTALKMRLAKPNCPECAQKSKKPEMADKSLETDESLSETLQATQVNASHPATSNAAEQTDLATPRINFIQEKIDADAMLKTCPMCGKIYNDSVTFQAFCEHVESHFNMETSDFGSMNMEQDFEYVSNTVGNF